MLPVPDKKKKSVNDDVPIFGASSSPSSSAPVVGYSDKGADSDLPIFGGTGSNKKKDGSENYGIGFPSASVSDVESTEQIAPKSFIENDIENSQYSRDNAKQFTFESIGQPSPMVAPIGADVMIAKEKEKKNILSNSNELSKYSKSRIDALTGDIQNLKKRLSAHTLPSSTQMGIPSLTPTQFYTDGGDSIKDEIAAKQKYLQQFKDNLLKLASHQVVKERNIPNPSQQDIESIGADVLQVTHDAGIGDDLEVLRTIGEVAAPRKVPSNVSLGVPTPSPTNYTASAIPKSDIDLTTQNIKYKFYKTGAEALQQYYINQAEEFGDKAKDNIAALNEINQKLSKPLPANDRDALVAAQQAIMQDSDVKEYLNSIDNAIVYSKKSKDAVDNFPQVKRQQMQQTLNDVYFNMLLAKDAATSAIPNNLGLRVANWLFGDTAGEEDVKSLSKATGISEDQVRDIINQRAQGWFSGSDKSGVRVPGFLPAIAQGMDETMGNAAMGIDRFLGAKNAEASNRILSDKLQSYNLRAQKAKLYDDAGKLNFNPYSLMNEMGRGIGQTAIYAAPSMVGGGLATGVAEGLGATVKNAENVGKVISGLLTVDSGFAASYEDAYKEAARYTNDESVRRAYAFKVGLANGLSETILEPAAVAKKVGLGKNTTKETFNTFLKNYKEGGAGKAVWEGLREAGGVIRDENIEEILVNIAQNKAKESDLGVDTSPSEFMDQSIQTIISTTLTTLPLGIGAGMNGARDQSGIRRNALFEAGNNPELYTGELKKKLDNGSLNQDQYNERVSVVNTMAAIVKNIKPTDIHGNNLSYDQKSRLAAQQFRILNNNRILESGATVEAEKPIIEADNKEAIKNQSDILNATPTEAPSEERVLEFDESVPQSSKDALIEKIQSIDSRNAMVKQAQQNPEEGIAFIQDQATGMTSDRSSAAQPTYDETVKMFGEDVVNHAVSVLPQDTKDMILRSWKDKGIEAPAPLINALQSTGGEMQEQAKSEVATEEKEEESPKVTIAEIIDKPVTYNGKKATIVQDGQALVAKIKGENVEYELGNIDEIKGHDISDYGIESEQSVVSANDDGDIVVRGNVYKNNYSNPLAAINYDKDGNVQSVTLDTENGQKRTFRGDIAEDIAYQIQLKEISKDNESRQQFEDFVEQDDETKQQIVSGYDEAVAAQGAEGDNEKVQGEPTEGAGTQQSEPESKPVERKKAEKRESPTTDKAANQKGKELTSKAAVNSEGIATNNASAAVEIPNDKSPKEAAKAYRDSAERLRKQGDIDGAEKLEKSADELEKNPTKKSSPKNKITTIEEAEEELKRLFALDSLTKDNEEGEVSLINKNGKINYEQLERTAEGIESGKIIFERFSPKEQRGLTDGGRANVESSVILATKSSSDKSFANSNEAQENAIEEYAKNDLSNNIASDKISSIKVGDKSNTIQSYLDKAKSVLQQLYPGATITTYDTSDEYYKQEKRPVGSAGVFHPKEQRLALNLELISKHGIENTVFHEVIHPIVNEAIVSREGALDSAWAKLMELKDVPGMDAVFEHVQAYAGRGANIQKVEGVTEFLTQVADGRIDISKMPEKTSSKIIDLINKIFEALGISKRIGTPTDLKRLADSIKSSFESADASAIKDVIGRRGENNTASSFDALNQKEQEDAIKDIIARSENIDEEKLKDLIKKYTGWDDEKVNSFFTPKQTGITHAQTKETAREFGFEEYEKDIPQTIDEWDREAEKKIKEGYDINALISKIESGHLPTNIEQRIMSIYVSGLEAEIEKNPTDENIEKRIRAGKASDVGGGREVARSLGARKGSRQRDNSLASFFVEQSEANNGATLTEQQKKDTIKEYNEIKAVQKALEEKILKLQQENAKLQAEQEVSRQKRSSGKSKKSHADYVTERNDILKNIKDKLKAARTGESGLTAVPIPYAKELFAIAPDVMKLTKSLVEEGITKLSDIVKDIHANLKDSIADITENDIHDIIAGRYNEPKPTRSQLSTQLQDLRTEAKLINEIESALRGEPKTERQKRHKNMRIEQLRNRLREIYRSQGKSYDEKALDATKKRIQKSIDELEAKLKSGDFSTPTKKEPIKLDKEAIALKDKLRELQHERAIRLMQEKYENRSPRKKALDRALEIANVPRTIMSSMDYSAPLRQALIPTVAHPIMASKAAAEMFRQSFSQKRFDRWFADLRENPRYDLMQKSGLYIADPHDPRLAAKEEAFMNNLAERIPLIGTLIKGSERAYVGYLNKMRVDLFNRMVDAFENDGFTYENSPELYAGLASWINNSTGRGNLGAIESAAPVLNSAFFSPRLIASRFNILGLSDFALAGRGLYGKMPPKMRVEALKDLIKFFGAGTILLSVLAYAFGGPDKDKDLQIELDPRSSDFGKIKSGNTRWDIWGGFQQYVRILAQLISGQKKSASTERVSELSGEGSFGETRGDVAQRFFRGKLSPVFSMGADILTGRTISGEKVTVPEEIKSHFAPLLFSDVKEAMKDNGIQSLFSVGIPSVFGVGVQTYNPRGYENVNRKEGIYKTLFDKDLNLSLPEQKEMTDKQYDKFLPVREKIFKDEWDNIIKYGAMLNEDGSPTLDENKSYGIKPFDKLTHDELTSIMKSISSRSTRLAEKEIGYEKPKDKKNQEFIK